MSMDMISLVSDQRMQNVIPILQDEAAWNRVFLVLSKDRRTHQPHPRFKKSAQDLKAVLETGARVVLICEKYVDPYDIGSTDDTVADLIRQLGDKNKVVVNISGGTKPMAIGALRAAQSAGIESLYTNTEDNEIIWLAPDGSVRGEEIKVAGLGVALYIRAYGEEIASAVKVSDLAENRILWAEIIGENHRTLYKQIIVQVVRTITEAYRTAAGLPARCKVSLSRNQRPLVQRLAEAGLWTWDKDTEEIIISDPAVARFLNGGWVEVYVAARVQGSGFFDDVLLNITLKGVEGELDLAAVRNGKLVLIECKSNVQRSEQLNKLDAFRRRLGGPFAKAFYARAGDEYAGPIGAQCKKLQLDGVLFGEQLRSIGHQIGEGI